jgi:hypothetical protein
MAIDPAELNALILRVFVENPPPRCREFVIEPLAWRRFVSMIEQTYKHALNRVGRLDC